MFIEKGQVWRKSKPYHGTRRRVEIVAVGPQLLRVCRPGSKGTTLISRDVLRSEYELEVSSEEVCEEQ